MLLLNDRNARMTSLMVYCLAMLLNFFSGQVFAEGNDYQIELMIFAQNMPNSEVFEQTESQIKWPADLTELSVYKKADTMSLANAYAALSKDPVYKPVMHVAWLQTIAEGALSSPVHIQGGEGALNGFVRIQRGQTLQLMVDLEYVPDQVGSAALIYRLNENRRIKLDEIHYLDHPKFGVVAKVSRL
jgi:hypothetical protein